MLEFLRQPWPWYISGVLIGLMVPLLLIFDNRYFGISSSMRHMCAAVLPKNKLEFFNYNWKDEQWNLLLVLGVTIGGFIGGFFLENPLPVGISEKTRASLTELGITDLSGYIPREIFNVSNLFTLEGFTIMIIGGFLIGFGTRYANGCTSGHSITGMSFLSWKSLVATIFFMLGGIIVTHFLLPIIIR